MMELSLLPSFLYQYAFKNANILIDIFVMVTATFAKPTKRYSSVNFIGTGSQETEVIEWSYNSCATHYTSQKDSHLLINTSKIVSFHFY